MESTPSVPPNIVHFPSAQDLLQRSVPISSASHGGGWSVLHGILNHLEEGRPHRESVRRSNSEQPAVAPPARIRHQPVAIFDLRRTALDHRQPVRGQSRIHAILAVDPGHGSDGRTALADGQPARRSAQRLHCPARRDGRKIASGFSAIARRKRIFATACSRPRKWNRSAGSRAGSRMISTTC